MEPQARPRTLIERVRRRRERHRERNRIYRTGFAVAGFVVLLAGVVMLVTPGPGLPAIVLGLAMLALEFVWAERVLERAIARMEKAGEAAYRASPARKAAWLLAGGVVGASFTAALIVWDVPLLPF